MQPSIFTYTVEVRLAEHIAKPQVHHETVPAPTHFACTAVACMQLGCSAGGDGREHINPPRLIRDLQIFVGLETSTYDRVHYPI